MTEPLESFQIDGVREFWSLPDVGHQCLEEAYALVKVMGSAFGTARDVDQHGLSLKIDTLNDLNDNIKASAMDGIARLIAMSRYCQTIDVLRGVPR